MTDSRLPTGLDYVTLAHESIDRVARTQRAALTEAADVITACVRGGGVVQAFGTGHSAGLAMEVAGRAGGLIATNLLGLTDGVMYGGAPADSLHWYSEREPEKAVEVLATADVAPEDVFVIISNSGANGSIVEMAARAKAGGHTVIALTSLEHSRAVPSAHPSGRKLYELADVVVDNGAPYGDSAMPLPDGSATGPISSLTTVVAVQIIMVDVVARLAADALPVPIFISANVPGGDKHNEALTARYGRRIRRMRLPSSAAV
ncbi:sugar isomerase domain-containing protein [Georgenia faecalis]|uniref:sugar isomerase domain-containing protein n=1 Tax=Georgenia faecalis TaxID=2483799 RepID=UPI000FDA0EF8|nr:SIS domain-containing protein [Georgenia faecalis]